MTDQNIREALVQKRAELTRLMDQARSGAFTIASEPNTRTQEDMDEQVARLQHALADVEVALQQIDQHSNDNQP